MLKIIESFLLQDKSLEIIDIRKGFNEFNNFNDEYIISFQKIIIQVIVCVLFQKQIAKLLYRKYILKLTESLICFQQQLVFLKYNTQ